MPTHHPTGPQHHGFYGRAKELAWLRSQFDAVAARGADGKFAGPRMAFIVAESGIGKSRLVQELYLRLTNDPQWDPPEVNYWPDAFREVGAQLRTVPDMRGHVPAGPPRFAWLGARWQPTDVRNVSERRSVLPEIRSSVTTHAEVLKSHGSAWAEAAGRVGEVFRNEGVGAAADAIGIPFFGLLTKVAKSVKDMATDRLAGPKSFDRVESNEIKSEIDEVLDCMRLLLDGKGAVPTVLWLDDAQWTDAETLEFVRTLWDQAQRRRWPLLIAVTHWEREWRELAQARRKGDADPSLVDFEGQRSVDTLHLANAVNDALRDYLAQRLPGLTPEQQLLLVEKAGGNFLTMVENTGELFSEPMWFVGERIDGALTDDAVAHIVEFETERERRVEQRFKALETEVKKILGWSTEMGSRFLADVVLEFAREKSPQLDPGHVLDKCVDPYAVLGRPSPYTREFRDKVFHHVAREHFQKFLKGDAARLSVVLRRHLVEWINNSFDAEGNEIWPDEEKGIAAPERSATGLTDEERRDLLGMALKELPLPEKPDWTNPEHVASLRACFLVIVTDWIDEIWRPILERCRWLEAVPLGLLPISVLSDGSAALLRQVAQEAGRKVLSEALSQLALRRAREGLSENASEESRLAVGSLLLEVLSDQIECGKAESARETLQEAIEIASELGVARLSLSLEFAINVRLRQASWEDAFGDRRVALEHRSVAYEMARSFPTDVTDSAPPILVQLALHLSLTYVVLGDGARALSTMLGVRPVELSEPTFLGALECCGRFAELRAILEEKHVHRTGILDSTAIDRREHADFFLNPLATACSWLGEAETAQQILQLGLDAVEEDLASDGSTADYQVVSELYRTLGRVHLRGGDARAAAGCLEHCALRMRGSSGTVASYGDGQELSETLHRLGQAHLCAGNLTRALESIAEAIEILQSVRSGELDLFDLNNRLAMEADLARCTVRNGNPQIALDRVVRSVQDVRRLAAESTACWEHLDNVVSFWTAVEEAAVSAEEAELGRLASALAAQYKGCQSELQSDYAAALESLERSLASWEASFGTSSQTARDFREEFLCCVRAGVRVSRFNGTPDRGIRFAGSWLNEFGTANATADNPVGWAVNAEMHAEIAALCRQVDLVDRSLDAQKRALDCVTKWLEFIPAEAQLSFDRVVPPHLRWALCQLSACCPQEDWSQVGQESLGGGAARHLLASLFESVEDDWEVPVEIGFQHDVVRCQAEIIDFLRNRPPSARARELAESGLRISRALDTQFPFIPVEWRYTLVYIRGVCRDLAIEEQDFARAIDLAAEAHDHSMQEMTQDDSLSARKQVLIDLLPLIRSELELGYTSQAATSSDLIEGFVLQISEACNGPMVDHGEDQVDSAALMLCVEGLELVAEVRQLQGRVEEGRAFLERASELQSLAEQLERAEQGGDDAPEES